MNKLLNSDDFDFELTTAILFNSIDIGVAIPDFDNIGIVPYGDFIELRFGDDISIALPADQLKELILKVAVQSSVKSAISIIEELALILVLAPDYFDDGCFELIEGNLEWLRDIHYKMQSASVYPDKHPDSEHFGYWELERDRERGAPTSIERWHRKWHDDRSPVSDDKAAA